MAFEDRIATAEAGGNPAARNPRSSATGLGQFIDSTWLSMIQKYRPDLAGLPRDQVLGMRTDPTLSREMIGHYGDENGATLRAAGLPDTEATRSLAHFAGPAGAQSVLSADPSTPVSGLLGQAAMSANPFARNMTAGDLTDWAGRRVGAQAPAMTMPGTPPAQAQASGAFGLSGPVAAGTEGSVTPAGGATMQAPAASPLAGVNAADVFKKLMQQGQQPATPAQPEQPSLLSRLMSQQQGQQPAAPFDASKFFALLQGRR